MHRAALALALCALALAGCSGLRDPYATTTTSSSTTRVPQKPTAAKTSALAESASSSAPLAAARTFMRGYLPYLYGLGNARAIAGVTPQLRDALLAQPMARDDGASPSHPRLEALRLLARRGDQAVVRAIVSDESGVYFPRELALVRSARGWRVTAVRASGG